MKRMLALLFCGVILFSFVACGETEQPTDTDTGASSTSSTAIGDTGSEDDVSSETNVQTDTSTDTETNTDTGSDKEEDPKEDVMKYGLILDDNGSNILVVNPELAGTSPADFDITKAIVWEWSVFDAKGSMIHGQDVRIDCTKYRYSSYYKKDVIIFCGSKGWAGIIDYETKELLFETTVNVPGPHSVELLPNGDMIMACSGNSDYDAGCILYYPLSAGGSMYCDKYPLWGAHSVVYDPEEELIYALGGSDVVSLAVMRPGTKEAKFAFAGLRLKLTYPDGNTDGGGHELIPMLGQPGKYFLASNQLMILDVKEGTVSRTDEMAVKYNLTNIKGMAYFADGISVQTAHNQGGTGTYRSSVLRVLYPEGDTLKEVMIPHRGGSATYKISVFMKDYR